MEVGGGDYRNRWKTVGMHAVWGDEGVRARVGCEVGLGDATVLSREG